MNHRWKFKRDRWTLRCALHVSCIHLWKYLCQPLLQRGRWTRWITSLVDDSGSLHSWGWEGMFIGNWIMEPKLKLVLLPEEEKIPASLTLLSSWSSSHSFCHFGTDPALFLYFCQFDMCFHGNRSRTSHQLSQSQLLASSSHVLFRFLGNWCQMRKRSKLAFNL